MSSDAISNIANAWEMQPAWSFRSEGCPISAAVFNNPEDRRHILKAGKDIPYILAYHSTPMDHLTLSFDDEVAFRGGARKGVWTLVPPDKQPQANTSGIWEVMHIYLPVTFMEEAVQAETGTDALQRVSQKCAGVMSARPVADLARRFFAEMKSPGALKNMMLEGLGTQLAATLIRNHGTSGRSAPLDAKNARLTPRSVRLVTDYVMDHLDQPVLVSELAEELKLSRYHFARAFTETTGQTPKSIILEIKMNAAMQLLQDTGKSITEIAMQVGYSDSSHFSRVFGAYTGMTPRLFRTSV
ncbi:MAG: AraC family transcriptional regulator [Pseudomonadota bacterium]